MAINLQKRSGTAVGNFNFECHIYTTAGAESPIMILPVDAVKGLGDSKTTTMRHRINPNSWAVMTPYPGLSTAEAVTLEGSFLFDAGDLVKLQAWRDQCKGKLQVAGTEFITGYYRELVVTPTSETKTATGTTIIAGSSIKLNNCIATRLSFSDFDINSPAIMNWSLEIDFEDMKITPPSA